MIAYRRYMISVRALQPHGYLVKVYDAINRPMGPTDMPELFENGGIKEFPDYGLAAQTARKAIDRIMDNDGIDPNTIIDVQARQLLKARNNADGYLKTHRRDQVKIVELGEEIVALEAALHTYINWTDIIVAERDVRIAELEAALTLIIRKPWNYWSADVESAWGCMKTIAQDALESEVK